MYYQSKQKGYSLVEVLVAVSILLIAIVGPLTIASKGLQNASLAKEQATAFFLAQEGIEAVVKYRDDAALAVYAGSGSNVWTEVEALTSGGACAPDNPCGVDIENNNPFFLCSFSTCDIYLQSSGRARYSHDSSSGELTKYNRKLTISTDANRVHVQSVVSWGPEIDDRVSLSTYLYNIYEN